MNGRYIVVMGVSGCGKSSVAQAIAAALNGSFVEADLLHPAENVARMASGIPLEDAHRWGWLQAVADKAREDMANAEGEKPVVIACSVLKRSYRDFLRDLLGELAIVYLEGSPELIRERMAAREGHFMPVGLLDSQFAILEPPVGEPNVVAVDIAKSLDTITQDALAGLAAL